MSCLGNVLWFIFGGFFSGISWFLAGCLWCITIVGIPWGKQCFKFAGLSLFPYLTRKGSGIWRRSGIVAAEPDLADSIRDTAGSGVCRLGMCAVCDHSGNSVWTAAF